jgi:hypothetical protein
MLSDLRGQQADKIRQLFQYDTERASVKYNPGEAPGPHVEGYEPPTDRIIDPMIGARAASMETQGTASELADIMQRMSARKAMLDDAYKKGLQLHELGLKAMESEFNMLDKLGQNVMSREKYQDDKDTEEKEMSIEDFLKLFGYDDQSTQQTETLSSLAPQYTPRNINEVVKHNGYLWKYDTKAKSWQQVGDEKQQATQPPSYFIPD